MPYQTIVVHADKSKGSSARIELAARLEQQEKAHLVGTALTGIPRYMYSGSPFDMTGIVIGDVAATAERRANEALAEFERLVARVELKSSEQRLLSDDEYSGLCLQARYADLVVLGQADPDGPGPGALLHDLPEYVVLNSGRPVLVVPYIGQFATSGNRVLVAWNGSVEAARAVTGAIPLLRRAAKVTIAVFNPQIGSRAHGEEPGADIALYLARHGVNVEVTVEQRPATSDVGNALLSLAANISADLIVMGAYGHTRLREMLLGGATRTVLASMTVPVLMAH
ncbi:universal stress protein [Massilia sp. NR 4-1]|uniref:universal stress protein n=1 Tax=Massilia sp. NR 4-1 TaxID=1678028 RepID=UPI00067B93FF|nr:universal stress protein [Massilia sp. NR 4-1]AKU20461.1 universal stress protein [Massilia sp. NR 4-1]